MKMLSVEEAKDQLHALVDAARNGDEVVLTENGTPVARVEPLDGAEIAGRAEAIQRFLSSPDRKMPIGPIDWTRDELHGR